MSGFNYVANGQPRQQTLFEAMAAAEYIIPEMAVSPASKLVSSIEPLTLDVIAERLPGLMTSVTVYNDYQGRPSGIIPANPLILAMASHQTQRLKSSKRARPDADLVYLGGRIFGAVCLGESAQRLFDHYAFSLGKGHKGKVWDAPPHNITLRTTTTVSGTYRLPHIGTNRRSSSIPTASAFIQVERQHSGTTACRFDGWAYSDDITSHVQCRGESRTVNVNTLAQAGVLRDLESLKRLVGGWL